MVYMLIYSGTLVLGGPTCYSATGLGLQYMYTGTLLAITHYFMFIV